MRRLLAITILLTICLSIPRFAHQTPDSPDYVNLAQYLQGNASQEALLKPFAYRVLVPFLSTLLPINDSNISIALLSTIATVAAYLISIPYMRRLGLTPVQVCIGLIFFVLSFPTFNYASSVMTDAAGFFVFLAGCLFLLKERYVWLSLTICVGVLVRESLLALSLIAILDLFIRQMLFQKKLLTWKQMATQLLIVLIPPFLTFLATRFFLFPDVPTNFRWGLSLRGFLRNFSQPKIGWLTFTLTLCPPLLLFFYGLSYQGWDHVKRLSSRSKALLLAITVVSITYIIYSNSIKTAYMSGRFVWPFYSVLIPVAVLSLQDTPMFAWLVSILWKFFGIRSESVKINERE